ncbi:alpha/beta hydrolase [Halomonas campisalis]|uniref:Alpha/beta hydrolase n=1 Tax=Billgrantia campisalis TaxID=74661 RepID=A0ABS9PB05_9GAMM|nr:alpha/beta hydrolase [Halomonas campisalis]MCG6658932.1 alpha/beta hydrolase [Halomonas campisalis]MDR5863653.1 alpha/beta hydrolase [Halomonas campisalis]
MAMTLATRVVAFLLVTGLIATLLVGHGSVSRGYEALLALGDIAAGSEESRLKQRTPDPSRESLTYAIDEHEYQADLYRPEEPRRGSLILVHGFTEAGRRDPRLMEFAITLSRLGFTVMVPDLEGLKDFSISTREADAIADAIRYATDELSAGESGTAVAAISLAVGPALIAAKQKDTKDRVRFLIALGGYYDLTDMLRYVTTGEDRGGAGQEAPPPLREGRWAVLLSQLHWLDDESDRAVLASIARNKLDDPHAAVQAEVDRLGPQGRAAYDLATNEDPQRVEALIRELPPPMVEEFEALDLSAQDLGKLEARLVLIHGPEDRVIPVSHSRRLQDALPQGQARLFEAGGLNHVEVSPGWRDGWGLWRATTHLLALGERE